MNRKISRKIVGIMLITALFLGTATISMGQDHNILITLSPLEASNPVGTTHTVIATVAAVGRPLSGWPVEISIISGPNSPQTVGGVTDASGQVSFTYTGSGGEGIDVIRAEINHDPAGNQIVPPIFSDKATKEWTFPAVTKGFMTGGGSIFGRLIENENADSISDKVFRVTHGFKLQCNKDESPNNLEVNWGGNKFHLEKLTSALCYDDKTIEPNPPKAGFDTYLGTGEGRYNGVSGAAAQWVFTDAGEPGKKDSVRLIIEDVDDNIVLDVLGYLDSGNQQAHK